MTEKAQYSPLEIGLLIVIISYFMFTLHALFTLQWIGEWEYLGGGSEFSTMIFVEDVNATVGLVFRFAASLIALVGVVYYLAKKGLSAQTATKTLRWILVFEGIYWLGLVATGAYSVYGFLRLRDPSIESILTSLTLGVIPVLVESLVLPISLFITAYKLSPNKPLKGAIKWGLITGTIYVLVFWLINTSIWISVINGKGTGYLTSFPETLVSFAATTIGMFALTIFTAYFAKKSAGTETIEKLKLKTVGAIIMALGLFFLWNYLTWIFFATDASWSDWYAWFLGHNMDLWMLSLPLVGLPLLFERKTAD
ncbi:MAG TPA: hypothetical protein VF893_06510 [Candidatus Bathyarchaeia archaeon]